MDENQVILANLCGRGDKDIFTVAEAATRTGATLVDASSGLETAPGVKDVDKIAAFLHAVARSCVRRH